MMNGRETQRVVAATWRLARAGRIEAELCVFHGDRAASLGLALILTRTEAMTACEVEPR
jgi:hypothetical protein